MKAMLKDIRELWRDIDKLPFGAPPGTETGGQLSFVVCLLPPLLLLLLVAFGVV